MEKGGATLKRLFLELGGKSAHIVLDDAPNFEMEVRMCILGQHAGQGCAVRSRLLVPRSRYQEAKDILKQAYAEYETKWGDFNDPAHSMGPVVNKKQYERVLNYIEIGKQEGATLLAGGKARPDKGPGYFIEPTCFVDVTNDMRIAQEEIFGPVLVVIPLGRRGRDPHRQRQRLWPVGRRQLRQPRPRHGRGQPAAHRQRGRERRHVHRRRPALRRLQAERHRPRVGRRGHRGIPRKQGPGGPDLLMS
jgi:hypothetical protein